MTTKLKDNRPARVPNTQIVARPVCNGLNRPPAKVERKLGKIK